MLPGLEVVRLIGQSSRSSVWLGRRRGFDVAVKVAKRGSTDEYWGSARQFRAEATAMARVSHPAIPRVYEVGVAEQLAYILMEFVDGDTLASRLAARTLDEVEVLHLGCQVAEVLGVIHGRGLVYRDLKPANVVIRRPSGDVALVDFGFATGSRYLGPSVGLGTAGYVAPELVSGSARAIDTRSDLYSLGCLLRDCVIGTPSRGGSASIPIPTEDDTDERLLKGRPGVSAGFIELLRRLVARDPADRFDCAEQVRDALAALLGSRHSDARASGVRSRGALVGTTVDAPRIDGTLASRLIGRARERHVLERLRADTVTGRGVLVAIRGPSGIGKTAFLADFLRWVDRDESTLVLAVSASEGADRPLGGVRSLLAKIVALAKTGRGSRRHRAAEALRSASAGLSSLLVRFSPQAAEFVGDETPTSLDLESTYVESLATVLIRFVRAAGLCVLAVDDFYALDAGSQSVLRRCLCEIGSSACLGLVTLPPALDARSESFLRTAGRSVELTLSELDTKAVRLLVREHLGQQEVDSELFTVLNALGARTPLVVLETLRTLLANGALTPHWGRWTIDFHQLQLIPLDGGMRDVLCGRLADLGGGARDLLLAVALMGGSCAVRVGLAACELSGVETPSVVDEVCGGAFVQLRDGSALEYVHRQVADLVIGLATADACSRVRRRLIAALESEPSYPQALVWLARHYAALSEEIDPERVFHTCVAAGREALDQLGNEEATAFLDVAVSAAARGGLAVPPEVFVWRGDALMGSGCLDEALASYVEIEGRLSSAVSQAEVAVKAAWIHEQYLDKAAAIEGLRGARSLLLARSEERQQTGPFRHTLAGWLGVAAPPTEPAEARTRRLRVLCQAYYQSLRLSLVSGDVLGAVRFGVYGMRAATRLGPSREAAALISTWALFQGVCGRRRAARRLERTVEVMAASLMDPTAIAHGMQLRSVSAAWRGDMDEALTIGKQCVTEYGHAQEFVEFCSFVAGNALIEVGRGRLREAWTWIERALLRVEGSAARPVILEWVGGIAELTLAATGRAGQIESRLTRLRESTSRVTADCVFRPLLFASHIHLADIRGETAEIDGAIQDFWDLGLDPRRVHPAVVKAYVDIGYVAIRRIVHGNGSERAVSLDLLRRALSSAKKASRRRICQSHVYVLRAYLGWFEGSARAAERWFAKAERQAVKETCPYASWEVALGRARLLREAGCVDAAEGQARVAALVAEENGCVYVAERVLAEFGLRRRAIEATSGSVSSTQTSNAGETARIRRHLRALLQVSRATTRELDPEFQVRMALDELIAALDAQRGFLFLREDDATDWVYRIGRLASGEDVEVIGGYSQSVVDEVAATGITRIVGHGDLPSQVHSIVENELRSVIASPLILQDKVVGVVYLDSRAAHGVFSAEDGNVLQALANQVPVALELGKVLRTQAEHKVALEDEIRARKRVEIALRESEERYRTMIEAAYDAIFVADAEGGRIMEVNQRACELLRRSKIELLGMRQIEIQPPDRREAYTRAFRDTVLRGESSSKGHYVVAADGERIPVEIVARVIQLGTRRVVQSVYRDMREQARLEQHLRQAEKMEAVGRLAGGIAHDFNNMLTVIRASVDGIMSRGMPPTLEADLRAVHSATERAGALTRQLLTFSRRHVVDPKVISLNHTVSDLVHILQRLLGENIRLVTELGPGIQPVKVDEQQLTQVLVNLAVNARDAMPSGGLLHVSTANVRLDSRRAEDGFELPPGEYVEIRVTDTGIGIPAEIQAKVFDPFFTTKRSGTGLGLASAYGIIKQSGGHIYLISGPGKGATFVLLFPVCAEGLSATRERSGPRSALGGHETILLVEDDSDVRSALCRTLEGLGYRVLTAETGMQALDVARSHPGTFRLAITDVVMPGMSGPQFAHELSRLQPEVKVLFVSGYTDGAIAGHGLRSSGVSFLQKPFSIKVLAGRVREMFEMSGEA